MVMRAPYLRVAAPNVLCQLPATNADLREKVPHDLETGPYCGRRRRSFCGSWCGRGREFLRIARSTSSRRAPINLTLVSGTNDYLATAEGANAEEAQMKLYNAAKLAGKAAVLAVLGTCPVAGRSERRSAYDDAAATGRRCCFWGPVTA